MGHKPLSGYNLKPIVREYALTLFSAFFRILLQFDFFGFGVGLFLNPNAQGIAPEKDVPIATSA